MRIQQKRGYEPSAVIERMRILVDRLWSRGLLSLNELRLSSSKQKPNLSSAGELIF